jgi:hypothetical protein
MLLTNGQCQLHFLAEAIPHCVYMTSYQWVNNSGKYADGFHNSVIDNKDGHIPSKQTMFTCTAFCHSLVEWPQNKSVHTKSSKSKLNPNSPDRSDYLKHNNHSGKNAC